MADKNSDLSDISAKEFGHMAEDERNFVRSRRESEREWSEDQSSAFETVQFFRSKSNDCKKSADRILTYIAILIISAVALFVADPYLSNYLKYDSFNVAVDEAQNQINVLLQRRDELLAEAELARDDIDAYDRIERLLQDVNLDIDAKNKEIEEVNSRRERIRERESWDTYESVARKLVERAPAFVLILIFVSLLSSMYRYNMRLAAFYDARSEAVKILLSTAISMDVEDLTRIFSPESIQFKDQKIPTGIVSEAWSAFLSRRSVDRN